MNKLLSIPIKEASREICSGTVRPSEICKASIKLTSIVKPLNSYINVTNDVAGEQASSADERQQRNSLLGQLDGIPIAVKDNYCVKGKPTTCASRMLANFSSGYNATVYEKLRTQGVVLIGKTNLDEFAMGSGTVDSFYGPTKNLWGSEVLSQFYSYGSDDSQVITRKLHEKDAWHIAGGSSGGSAVAVATGTCYAALGSDTGGSTRNPASYCGLVGLKPTYGLVSRYGLIPLLNSMDVPGILARTVDDAVLILNAIAGPDQADPTTVQREYVPINLSKTIDISNLRIGIPNEYGVQGISEEIAECWEKVSCLLIEAGASVVPVSLPHTDYSIVCYSVLNRCDVASNLACYDGVEYGHRANEWKSVHELYKKTRSEGFNDVVKGRILVGNYFLLAENYEKYYVKAMKMRRLIAQDFDVLWNSNVDLLLTPTTLTEAPRYDKFIQLDNQTQCLIQDHCTQPANMAGLPAINVPIKLSRNRLPLSLQLIAPLFHEQRLLTVAKWIEQTVRFPRLELKNSCLLE
ncbi:Glutamyl-tRNA(Gln) amidotransferase subunit A like protein [Trachymyrmex septentrionalis]|uniref:Glutamyl-tRNA(Gln) amidotransferase subunit A, mitochondrial n=1 Tax=Trachymyrmex septentrionalis TaxID=34720 RepID=A0A195FPJ1_9HYME|nr:PREDICTED: glutamyl-tRNA(Gln) amidotransferase subunit A, mitochondrial [Trachymyrmex septentrionalis]KYN42227.1 Glutamyl-tRNA(Gln) amidotransferase subunit A like protein [Trachymyrmex septentrionalis]